MLLLPLALLALAGSIASPHDPLAALALALVKLGAQWPAFVFVLASWGLAWPLASLWRGAREPAAIQLAVGAGVMLWLCQLLGSIGALGALLGPPVAISLCVGGLSIGSWQLARGVRARKLPSPPGRGWVIVAPAVALLMVASGMPPGWLWGSEFAGFDALSYHLQLPQEWLASPRVEPVAHNVYSYLPGAVESAFVFLARLTLAPTPEGDGPAGLLAGDGWRAIACQGLPMLLTIAGAFIASRGASRLCSLAGLAPRACAWGALLGAGIVLATPWAVVVGSLAYNEPGVNLLLAGALLVACETDVRPASRGAIVGMLVGCACGCKPTALLFAGVPAGVLLLGMPLLGVPIEHRRDGPALRGLARAVIAGSIAGCVALAPWLVRNALAGGNPIFPFAPGVFGPAHWATDQLERYHGAHAFHGTIADRLRLLAWSAPGVDPNAPLTDRFRGFAHGQWGLFAPAVMVAAGLALASGSRVRRAGMIVLGAMALQCLAWLGATHLQSRFLLPCLPTGAMLIALTGARLATLAGERPDARAGVALLLALVVLFQTALLFRVYGRERGGMAGAGLGVFPSHFAGVPGDDPEGLGAFAWVNRELPPGERVYLLGDAAAFYLVRAVVSHTTFDASPLGEAMREHPGDAVAWREALRRRGVRWILYCPPELARYHASGWYDRLVTPESVAAFLDEHAELVRAWPGEGRYLFRLREDAPPTPPPFPSPLPPGAGSAPKEPD